MPKKCQMNKTIYYYQYPFPIGKIMIACKDQAIIYCGQPILLENGIYENTDCLKNIAKQIEEYFQKRRQSFDFHYIFLKGTAFQKKVWQAVMDIPYGQTRSYRDIAEKIGHPRAYRAVGSALRECPFSLLIPCHRVIGSSQKLGGYGKDIDVKIFLLQHEQADLVS